MTAKELYEKCKNKQVKVFVNNPDVFVYGIIVGYVENRTWPLIAGVTRSNVRTWNFVEDGEYIFNMIDNKLGYVYAEESDIIPFKFGI